MESDTEYVERLFSTVQCNSRDIAKYLLLTLIKKKKVESIADIAYHFLKLCIDRENWSMHFLLFDAIDESNNDKEECSCYKKSVLKYFLEQYCWIIDYREHSDEICRDLILLFKSVGLNFSHVKKLSALS